MDSPVTLRVHKRLSTTERREKLPHLIANYGDRCFWCECRLTQETITIDHYIPLSLGGSNETENLRLACYGCNQKRGNAMPEDTHQIIADKSRIRFPKAWKSPKYYLGQQMKQGQIAGVEYHPPGTKRASDFGEYWTYWVLLNGQDSDVESFKEENLQPLSSEELQREIESQKAFIEVYQNNIAAMSEQFEEVE